MNIDEIIKTAILTEDSKTNELFTYLNSSIGQDYFNKEQLLKILKWKSPRPLKHYSKNSEKDIIEITRAAFEQNNEKLKIHLLTALKGVKYPSASAILMFRDKSYPVLDIRVWQQLYMLGYLKTNPKGLNFELDEWQNYLLVIRNLASRYNITARQLEKALFDYHKINQTDNLY